MGQLLETVLEDIASSRELQTSFLKPHVRMVHGFQKIMLLEDDSPAGSREPDLSRLGVKLLQPVALWAAERIGTTSTHVYFETVITSSSSYSSIWGSWNRSRVGRPQYKAVLHTWPRKSQMPQNVKVFRLSLFEWWAGYDLATVKSAYLAESGLAKEEAFDVEEELPQDALDTVRIYPNRYAKESSTFQQELARMVAGGQEFPCYLAGR